MSTGDPGDIEAHVRASARLLGLPLDDAQVQRVTTHLARTRELAELLDSVPLEPELDPAALYCPAPFPTGGA